MLAPIVLFVYNRLWHAKRTVEALEENVYSNESEIFIFSDGPKNNYDEENVRQVREYIRTIHGFKDIHIVEREKNFGLSDSLISGISSVVNQQGKIIVLEDDILTSPFFLKLMNEALALYEKDENILSIHGYTFPIDGILPQTFFLKAPSLWGWATWQRAWQYFERDGKKLLSQLNKKKLTDRFDFNNSYSYLKVLENQVEEKSDSWAIRWYASGFLADKLTLHFGTSLTYNTGNDGTGIHCDITDIYDTQLEEKSFDLTRIPVEENITVLMQYENSLSKWKMQGRFDSNLKCGSLDYLLKKLLGEKISFIDVGAYEGEFTDYMNSNFNIHNALLIEPLPDRVQFLNEKYSSNASIKIINCAIGDTIGEKDFIITEDKTQSSLLQPRSFKKKQNVIKVHISTLDHIIMKKYKLPSIDLIKIDSQGFDLRILRNTKNAIERFSPIIITEFIFHPLYKEQGEYFEQLSFFKDIDYKFGGIFNIHYNKNGLIAFADLLFVPESIYNKIIETSSKFDHFHNYDVFNLLEQNQILLNTCNERLELIHSLVKTAEERLKVIETLDEEIKRLKENKV